MAKKSKAEIEIIAELRRVRLLARKEADQLRSQRQVRAEAAVRKFEKALDAVLAEAMGLDRLPARAKRANPGDTEDESP
jgi:hypothetical protein